MSETTHASPPVSIITGAGSGIGRAAACRLSTRGPVVLVGRRPEPLLETGGMLGPEGTAWVAIPSDITKHDDRQRIVDETVRACGHIDALINNAAVGTCAPLEQLNEQQIIELIDINLTAPLLLTRAALPYLQKTRGCVVSIGSRAAHDPMPGLGAYGCTKSGLEGIARLIAAEYPGVRAYTVHPGAVETTMLRSIVSAEDLPTNLVLNPDDIAAAIESFVIGQRPESSGSHITVAKN